MNDWAGCAKRKSWARMGSVDMKVVHLRQTGGPELLEYTDVPLPEPGPQEVRIRAHAIGVGKPDVLIRQGSYKWMPPLPRCRVTNWPAWWRQ
jgi:hypothetical protein